MATNELGRAIGPELASVRIAGGVLPKVVLNSFDMVAIFVATSPSRPGPSWPH